MIPTKQQGQPLQYIAVIFATLLILIGAFFLSLYLLQEKGMPTTASPSGQFLYFADGVQNMARGEISQPTIRIIGGSGSLYSVSACELGRALGVPVANNALQAGIGLDYILYRAKKFLRPGDTAVLLLEPQLLDSANK